MACGALAGKSMLSPFSGTPDPSQLLQLLEVDQFASKPRPVQIHVSTAEKAEFAKKSGTDATNSVNNRRIAFFLTTLPIYRDYYPTKVLMNQASYAYLFVSLATLLSVLGCVENSWDSPALLNIFVNMRCAVA